MDIDRYLEILREEGELLLAAALRAGWDSEVPTCPGWRVRDLVTHQGAVHRWAGRIVSEGRTRDVPAPEADVPDELLPDWFARGHRRLLAALREAPADLECWTFLRGARSPLSFWARRQAHETAVHRVDAELASGPDLSPVDPLFAADGIDELLVGFHTRPTSRVRSARPRVLRVTARGFAPWTLRLSPEPPVVSREEDAAADCAVTGEAADLYLALWNRRPYGERVSVEGDAGLARLWHADSAVRWSDPAPERVDS
ncbi:maleylpyruvate isomerase family mycothiol-dependent enzyme [Streptomyces radiopugnans]|uniref:maleylpyruvate isomerase family mycothiol-dependent enzyme n=1 Tax=Streptomyces radiopugnans TaxID=403935 RepID=UPI003F1A29CE